MFGIDQRIPKTIKTLFMHFGFISLQICVWNLMKYSAMPLAALTRLTRTLGLLEPKFGIPIKMPYGPILNSSLTWNSA